MKVNGMGRVDRSVKNVEIMGKKIGTAAVPAIPKGSMESINFLGGPIGEFLPIKEMLKDGVWKVSIF